MGLEWFRTGSSWRWVMSRLSRLSSTCCVSSSPLLDLFWDTSLAKRELGVYQLFHYALSSPPIYSWTTQENIAFEPPLPLWKRTAIHRLGMGNVAKVPLRSARTKSVKRWRVLKRLKSVFFCQSLPAKTLDWYICIYIYIYVVIYTYSIYICCIIYSTKCHNEIDIFFPPQVGETSPWFVEIVWSLLCGFFGQWHFVLLHQ